MTDRKVLNLIGAFIFGGIGLVILLQIHQASYRIEAGLFFLLIGIAYYALIWIYRKKHGAFIPLLAFIGLIAIALVFLQGVLFGGAH
ncbi:hypothetical protein [Mesobacillus harenae]|uniref:hypothetical protein n=1 Tax=Mesobacillus harenae TaxID=2213203 RepID=UPI0015803C59|nr:hypothetical protein [Mesobacillus harenae]